MNNERAFMALALAPGGIFALALGVRSAQPLFISSINSATGIGYATISLAFAVAQLVWGLRQPVTGAIGDRWGPRPVMLARAGLIAIPMVFYITDASSAHPHPHAQAGTLTQAVHDAVRDPSFLLLTAGFFTCGFHIAFIATHLPGYVALCQLPATVSAWSLSIIGLFNIAGSLWVGRHIQTRRMKLTLAGVYFARAICIAIFFFAPKTPLVFFVFAAF